MGRRRQWTAVGVIARSELRRGWRSTLALAVLLGVVAGVVLGAATGARRTQTAFPRLLRNTNAIDALVGVVAPPAPAGAFYAQIRALAEVAIAGRVPGIRVLRVDAAGRID